MQVPLSKWTNERLLGALVEHGGALQAHGVLMLIDPCITIHQRKYTEVQAELLLRLKGDPMTKLRIFVPAGGQLSNARLQRQLIPVTQGDVEPEQWRDIPIVYEDPDDEVVECPRINESSVHMRDASRVCGICFGSGQVRRGKLRKWQEK